MLQLERHNHIVALLEQNGAMRVSQIAERLSVSRETIRRDLTELEGRGIIYRSHGGAILAERPKPAAAYSVPVLPEFHRQGSFRTRSKIQTEAKTRMARQALSLIRPKDTVLLDGSSSSWFLARQLPEMEFTVVTPSVSIIQVLMSRPSIRLIGLGGDFSALEESFFGEATGKQLSDKNIDTLFFSCQGLERDRGIFTSSEAHASLLRQMFLAARRVVLLADATKLGQIGSAHVCGFGDVDVLITEKFDDPLLQKEMIWHNIKVMSV
ncbi:DeoR/GlpR family DNA-binding transcription regulator [Raoultella planticola]|uniref:DeoR/GlpR family DNA-binding transcription regulator n=1 Tax=Raoultella planticola TaxID=575 RepID=UPI00388F926D